MIAARPLVRILATIAVMAFSSPLAADKADRWLFRVYLEDREIGYHEFSIVEGEAGQEVEIKARFDVRVLFFNAYRYDHHNRETWAGDCLAGIHSVTNDNGDEFLVTGQSQANDFVLAVNQDETRLGDACIRTFAYWNPAILRAERLLNAQTGELVDVTINRDGTETLEIGPHRIPAERFTIEMEDGPIRLWYAPGGRHWLALEAETESGRTLRYVPLVLPWNAVGETRLAMD